MIILTIKQLKRRVVQGLVEPELVYMPWGKKLKSIDYIYLNFKELQYENYDEVLEEYPEYSEQILKFNKYSGGLKAGLMSEAIFYTNDYKPMFKMMVDNDLIQIKNIPCGTYHIRIIKSQGYVMNEYTIVVDNNSNQQVYIIELYRSYIKAEFGIEESENPVGIYEKNTYDEDDNRWLINHCLGGNASGRMFYKIYDYNNKYLGKTIFGYTIYDPNFVLFGGDRDFDSYYYFKYYPTNFTEQHLTGKIAGELGFSGFSKENIGTSITKEPVYSAYIIGHNNYINMPVINKNGYPNLQMEISYIPNGNTNSKNVNHFWTLFDRRKECFIPNGVSNQQYVGDNVYFEDGMTDELYATIRSGKAKDNPLYLVISNDGLIGGHVPSNSISYDNCKNTDENTICYYADYTVYSDDYNDYSDFAIRMDYDFNESR